MNLTARDLGRGWVLRPRGCGAASHPLDPAVLMAGIKTALVQAIASLPCAWWPPASAAVRWCWRGFGRA